MLTREEAPRPTPTPPHPGRPVTSVGQARHPEGTPAHHALAPRNPENCSVDAPRTWGHRNALGAPGTFVRLCCCPNSGPSCPFPRLPLSDPSPLSLLPLPPCPCPPAPAPLAAPKSSLDTSPPAARSPRGPPAPPAGESADRAGADGGRDRGLYPLRVPRLALTTLSRPLPQGAGLPRTPARPSARSWDAWRHREPPTRALVRPGLGLPLDRSSLRRERGWTFWGEGRASPGHPRALGPRVFRTQGQPGRLPGPREIRPLRPVRGSDVGAAAALRSARTVCGSGAGGPGPCPAPSPHPMPRS